MNKSNNSSFFKQIACIEDPRHHNTRHLLFDMFLIACCALISGAESYPKPSDPITPLAGYSHVSTRGF